jgi:hypothetical protein
MGRLGILQRRGNLLVLQNAGVDQGENKSFTGGQGRQRLRRGDCRAVILRLCFRVV